MDFTIPAQKLGLDLDEYIELIQLFLETGGNDLEGLDDALDNNNIQAIIERSHSLKGASGNLGITDIYEIAKDVESKARENNLDGIEKKVEEIKRHFKNIIDSLEG